MSSSIRLRYESLLRKTIAHQPMTKQMSICGRQRAPRKISFITFKIIFEVTGMEDDDGVTSVSVKQQKLKFQLNEAKQYDLLFDSDLPISRDQLQSGQELWIVSTPHTLDVANLHGAKINLNADTPQLRTKMNDCLDINISPLQKKSQKCMVMLDGTTKPKLKALETNAITKSMYVIKPIPVPEVTLPHQTKSHVPIPTDLKMRNTAYGTTVRKRDGSEVGILSEERSGEMTEKSKKKKRKQSISHVPVVQYDAVICKEEPDCDFNETLLNVKVENDNVDNESVVESHKKKKKKRKRREEQSSDSFSNISVKQELDDDSCVDMLGVPNIETAINSVVESDDEDRQRHGKKKKKKRKHDDICASDELNASDIIVPSNILIKEEVLSPRKKRHVMKENETLIGEDDDRSVPNYDSFQDGLESAKKKDKKKKKKARAFS